MISQEKLYQLLGAKEYQQVVDFLYKHKVQISTDPLLSSAAKTSIIEFLRVSLLEENFHRRFLEQLERLYLLKSGKFLEMTNEQYRDLTISLASISSNIGDNEKAYQYAKLFPKDESNEAIINSYEREQPKEVEHEQSQFIRLTHNRIDHLKDSRISLFKSIEEQKMFLAFKRIFDTYQIYPNVGLSNIISFEEVKGNLSSKERSYFFKATVDLVVFEPFNFYEPIYFFELDSIWHDEDRSVENDKMKDKIFSVAGLRLYRIRDRKNEKIDEEEFVDLVREVRSLIDD